MFTGLVREMGAVRSNANGRLVIETTIEAAIGDSIAIDGVCLTVVANDDGALAFDVVEETLRRTALATSGRVNLEPALRVGEPLGGHYVQGHVDGVGTVRSLGDLTWFDAPADLHRYIAEKGSIAVQGTSLTVADVDEAGFAVALIPHTLVETTLGELRQGDPVNLEADVLAKYVEKLLQPR